MLKRSLLSLLSLTVALLLGASCSGVLDLNGRTSAADELCNLVDRCFGGAMMPDCEARLSAQLSAADSDVRAQWLATFGDAACLETCNNARLCLDVPPLCASIGAACASNEGCCGFSMNDAVCGAGSCCKQDGRACSDNGECCDGACRDGLCGGLQCLQFDEPCEVSQQCCSGSCGPDKLCSDETCLPLGADCNENAQCCDGVCELFPMEGVGFCGGNICVPEGGDCDPLGDLPCCGVAECILGVGFGGYACTSCRPTNTACNPGDNCCEGLCGASGRCPASDVCSPVGAQCMAGGDCCAGLCEGSMCCEDSACEHTVCKKGTALAPSCDCGEPPCTTTMGANSNCVAAVCGLDPYCCCNEWDDTCIALAESTCGVLCPKIVN